MIAPLVALKRRARNRNRHYRLPPLAKQKALGEYPSDTKTSRIALPPTPVLSSTPVLPLSPALPPTPVSQDEAPILALMAFGREVEVEEIMMDDEPVNDGIGMDFGLSGGEEDGDYTSLEPKIPFKQRVDPFVGPDNKKFLKTEDYFASLLRSPNLTIEGILEGTFDAHEINLITPHSGPVDVVNWQRRNARRYYENLEMRFKGHPDTLAFKLSCLYFGLPVEPLRMGILPFDLPPDRNLLDTKKNPPDTDYLDFLNKYEYEDQAAYDRSNLSLRGGGASGYMPVTDAARKRKKPAAWGAKAVQDVSPEGYEMDFAWDSAPAANARTKDQDTKIRLYGWQGVMSASLNYSEFVHQADRLISNWKYMDLPICVEIWGTSPVECKERVTGTVYHGISDAPTNDPIWNIVRKYFRQANTKQYACFVRRGDEDSSTDEDRPGGYQPSSSDKYVVRIEDETRGDVAYMRVPDQLDTEYKPHQFSNEYMLAMQSLLMPEKPHAWISFQHGLVGDSYQYLDPPGGLWDRVLHDRKKWSSVPTLSLKLKHLDKQVVPLIVPGTFRPGRQSELNRRDFNLAYSATDGQGLGQFYRAVESSIKTSGFKSECSGFEIWCPGTNFKDVTEQPTFIRFSGSITNLASLEDWQDFLASSMPSDPFCLVVRPVYKTYRLRRPDSNEKVDLLINQYDLKDFKAFVHNRLHGDYNPRDPAQVLVLSSANQQVYQPQMVIRRETTEEEWLWIRRNIVEPDLVVTVQDQDSDWRIPPNAQWGPRYVPPVNPVSISRPRSAKPSTGNSYALYASTRDRPTNTSTQKSSPLDTDTLLSGMDVQKAVDDLFKNSKNTMDEATRMRELRDRSFTNTNSIFTNPLKPVMPLHGPPLESIIKTGPGMPGVSIAMMTPTEMLQLQREVHSLRFQLLDRTRECPYADCDRYFTFADADGLDRHIREDHNILRCFLCDKDEHLLPYYNTEQIKNHFVTEHVPDILKAFGRSNAEGTSPTQPAGQGLHRETTPATSESSLVSEISEDEDEDEDEKGNEIQQQEQPKKRAKVSRSVNPFAETLSLSDSELTEHAQPKSGADG
ncbi:hypothetical protein O1611_g8783 [Lasiodiplodia mahajangana]|uniref:Uncharacterized protein n=1 Tax=Lasiodiplodia mahajangana TaxID=1108764 RepID=A0ACC2JC39_9PEZI|nr:hypothetical protein O1611_g8783 [Lasiodiplodia mahajangana]